MITDIFSPLWQMMVAVVLLALSISWKPQRGKALFIAFIVIGFLAAGLVESTAFLLDSWNRFDSFWFILVLEFFADFLRFCSSLLLIIFAIVRCSGDTLTTAYTPANPPSGITWNIEQTPQQRIAILRRREWGFLIDLSPVFLMFVYFFLVTAMPSNGFSADWFTGVVLLLLSIIQILYLPLKDILSGRSIGKYASGCRVVDAQLGTIAGKDKLVLRNLILLIPAMPIIELLVASFRPDRRRLGDLIAGTMVTHGPPMSVNGIALPTTSALPVEPPKHVTHPLDD